MNYQIGTFFVNELSNGSYQISYMIGLSTNPEKLGKPSALIENAGIRYLRMSYKEYRAIMESFDGEYKVIFRAEHGKFPGHTKQSTYEHGEIFFKDKSKAEAAMDWANARLAELHLLGQEYKHGEELLLRRAMPKLIPYQIPTPPKGNQP